MTHKEDYRGFIEFPLSFTEEFCGIFWKLFRRLKKFLFHLFQGTSEIERICSSEMSPSQIAISLKTSLVLSRQLEHLAREVFQLVELNIDQFTKEIIEKKLLPNNQRLLTNLNSSFVQFNAANLIFISILKKKDEPYDRNNEKHEMLLESLWTSLKPNIRRLNGRLTNEWQEIGFQGKDPATDFRGMGILGLEQLVFFATKFPDEAKRCLEVSCHPGRWYPFAITGINITLFLVELIKQRLLDHLVFQEFNPNQPMEKWHKDAVEAYHNTYCKYFIRFNQLWTESDPTDLMAFPYVFRQLRESIKSEVYSISFHY